MSGYATQAERFAKSRRKAALGHRLAAVRSAKEAGRPSIVVGGGRLWRSRQRLRAAQLTQAQWEQRWADERMFLTADGETGEVGGT